MKVTDKQSIEFNLARNKFLRETHIFVGALKFAEHEGDYKIRNNAWLMDLEKLVKSLEVEDLREMNGVEYGYRIANYKNDIERVFLKQFSKVIPPFDLILSDFNSSVYNIFIVNQIQKKH